MKSVALERLGPLSPGGYVCTRRQSSLETRAGGHPVCWSMPYKAGGRQMRKQVRSTFRTPGPEDQDVAGNAQRSRGAEIRAYYRRDPLPRLLSLDSLIWKIVGQPVISGCFANRIPLLAVYGAVAAVLVALASRKSTLPRMHIWHI
jgi:hypothetical protein